MELNEKPLEDFVVNTSESLDNFVTDSEEIWLVQCPISRVPELEGKELKVELDKDGIFGGLVDSSGEEMDLVSFASQDANATVIIPSEESTIAGGNITRRVSIVRYPEPKELLETMKAKTRQKLVGAVTDSSGKHSTLTTQSSRHRSGQSVRHSASTRSSKPKSLFSGFTETPKSSKRKHSESSSGKHLSSTSKASGSSERSGKSKKKKMKKEE